MNKFEKHTSALLATSMAVGPFFWHDDPYLDVHPAQGALGSVASSFVTSTASSTATMLGTSTFVWR